MFNKFGEFYRQDAIFAAALNCKINTIAIARREFAKLEWIGFVPGRMDRHGRGVSTVYKAVKWSTTPKKGEGKQFVPFQRYALEILLRYEMSYESIVVYVALSYFRYLKEVEDDNGNYFFITKKKLKELTGIDSQGKIEKCLAELYQKFQYDDGDHLFEYKDQYHKYKFTDWGLPSDPEDDENSRNNQNNFWDKVSHKAKNLEGKKRENELKRQLSKQHDMIDYFEDKYKSYYGTEPKPFDYDVVAFLSKSKDIGKPVMKLAINQYFNPDVWDVPPSQRRTLKRFLEMKYWERILIAHSC